MIGPGLNAALADATQRLAAVSATPRLDAELLMAHALGVPREAMLLRSRDLAVPPAFVGLVARRLTHEPVAYIVGHKDFWTITLAVSPAVLIPRPDSEALIEAAIEHFGGKPPARILDLGIGSGALLLAALSHWREATGRGVDQSAEAVAQARANAEALGLGTRAEISVGGWEAALGGDYDLVLCNPPYVGADEPLPDDVAHFEPTAALFAGADGLDDYRRIAPLLRLPAGGVACLEIGRRQAAAVSSLFRDRGFLVQVRPDLAGLDRCAIITCVT